MYLIIGGNSDCVIEGGSLYLEILNIWYNLSLSSNIFFLISPCVHKTQNVMQNTFVHDTHWLLFYQLHGSCDTF